MEARVCILPLASSGPHPARLAGCLVLRSRLSGYPRPYTRDPGLRDPDPAPLEAPATCPNPITPFSMNGYIPCPKPPAPLP